MLNLVSLKPTASGYEFESEADLEDFIWENLQALFGVHPLKRQHYVSEQFCDIVAVGENQQLVVLELKNTEDRYVVQQLTRYYDALVESQEFSDEVDYNQPVRLVAIAPSFHRDNFCDRKYHTLTFEFWQFSVIEDDEKFYLNLINLDTEKTLRTQISYEKQNLKDNLPPPSRALLNLLKQCNETDQAEILKIRQQILSFDYRMQENSKPGIIKYCQGNSQICCAELRFDDKLNQPALFLWLPCIDRRTGTSRLRIATDWEQVFYVFPIKRGTGKLILPEEIKKMYEGLKKNETFFSKLHDKKMLQKTLSRKKELEQILINFYINHVEVNHKINIGKTIKVSPLNYLVKIALSIWLKKVDKSKK